MFLRKRSPISSAVGRSQSASVEVLFLFSTKTENTYFKRGHSICHAIRYQESYSRLQYFPLFAGGRPSGEGRQFPSVCEYTRITPNSPTHLSANTVRPANLVCSSSAMPVPPTSKADRQSAALSIPSRCLDVGIFAGSNFRVNGGHVAFGDVCRKRDGMSTICTFL